jgi:hypothetical protein
MGGLSIAQHLELYSQLLFRSAQRYVVDAFHVELGLAALTWLLTITL